MKVLRIALIFVLAAVAKPAVSATPIEIAVIVHSSNPNTTMSAEDVRSHYMKQKSAWSNGEKIRPVESEMDDTARMLFIAKILKTNATDLERHWLEIKYRSAESPPKRMEDDEGAIKYVGTFKGGIGFVLASSLEKAKDKPIKVVLRFKS
jgi:ABC-type phosphate transport system substrate-binding protein